MTSPDPASPFPPQVSDEAPPPFDSSLTFVIDKPINLEQLTSEIQTATKSNAGVAMSGPINGNEAISSNNTVTLSVTPDTLSKAKIQKAIDDHAPDIQFGIPQNEQDYSSVLQKVNSDPTAKLTPDELQAAVRGLLVRSIATPLINGR